MQAPPPFHRSKTTKTVSTNICPTKRGCRIWALVEKFESQAVSDFQARYARDSKESSQALEAVRGRLASGLPVGEFARLKSELEVYRESCISYMDDLFSNLEMSVGINGDATSRATKPLPRICPRFFISQLATKRWRLLPNVWKIPIVNYGLALHDLQRAERLLVLASPDRENELIAELANPGHTNWNPLQLPLVLLMQIESKLLRYNE